MSNYRNSGRGGGAQSRPDNCFMNKAKNKTSQNAPDYWGNIELSEDVIRYLAFQLKNGQPTTLKTAIWRKENQHGVYLSLNVSVPRDNGGERPMGQRQVQSRQATQSRQQNWVDEGDQAEDPFGDSIPF